MIHWLNYEDESLFSTEWISVLNQLIDSVTNLKRHSCIILMVSEWTIILNKLVEWIIQPLTMTLRRNVPPTTRIMI